MKKKLFDEYIKKNIAAGEKSLAETNPYLKDPEMRKKLVRRSVRTSCGVEGIKAPHYCKTEKEFFERVRKSLKRFGEKMDEIEKKNEY